MSGAAERLTSRALGRALLARQGLIERREPGVAAAVEAVGALQAQHWPALPPALWSRVRDFEPAQLHAALDAGEVVVGTLLRGTIHLVSAREHAAYAAVVEASDKGGWQRTKAVPGPQAAGLRTALAEHTRGGACMPAQLAEVIEAWVADHPGALPEEEVAAQRERGWRPFFRWCGLVRVPADGRWGAKTPQAFRAAPGTDAPPPDPGAALDAVVVRHLRAFGPAGPEDVASWTGRSIPDVRAALTRLESRLVRLEDAEGGALHDLPDAPRPGEDADAPVRLLPEFDSTLLAYAPRRRERIWPERHRDAVYVSKNLRMRAVFLVDGLVAGTWSVEVARRAATLTLRPLERLSRATRRELGEEAEQLLTATQPDARSHAVAFDE